MNQDDVMSMAVRLMMFGEAVTEEMASSCLHQAKSGKNQLGEFYLGYAKSAVAHIDQLPSKVAASKRWNNWKCDPKPISVPIIDDVGAYSMSCAEWRGISAGRPSPPKNPAGFMYGEITPPPFMWGELAGWNS